MKMCPNCRNQIEESAPCCPICGTIIGTAPNFEWKQSPPPVPEYTTEFRQIPTPADSRDHTAQFSSCDISENKIFAAAAYILGPLGILIALLASPSSKFAMFHVRQALKLTVIEVLGALALVITSFILWIIRLRSLMALMIMAAMIGFVTIHLSCFAQVCSGKAADVLFLHNLKL